MVKLLAIAGLLIPSWALGLTHDQISQAQNVIPRFRAISPSVFAGAGLGRWQTQEGCPVEFMASIGFRTKLNLRNWRDDLRALMTSGRLSSLSSHSLTGEHQACRVAGIECMHFPLSSSRYPSSEDETKIMEALQALDQATIDDPAYIHCEYGIDRTGLVIALYRVLYHHWSPADAYAEWLIGGHNGVRRLATQRLDRFFFKLTGYKPDGLSSDGACDQWLTSHVEGELVSVDRN